MEVGGNEVGPWKLSRPGEGGKGAGFAGLDEPDRDQRVIVGSAAPSTFVVIWLLSESAARHGKREVELLPGSLTTTFGGFARQDQ